MPQVRLVVAGSGFLPAATLCHRLDVGPGPALVAFACLGLLACLGLPTAYAAGLGATAWAMQTGFGINDLGQLTFARADLLRLLLLITVCLAASWSTGHHRPTPRRPSASRDAGRPRPAPAPS